MRFASTAVAVMLIAAPALAGPRDFVIEHAGVGGTQQQADPYIQQFLRYTEQALGWPANSATGAFFPEPDESFKKYLAEKKPGLGMIDPDQVLELYKKESLEVIGTVSGKNQSLGHLSVVAKDAQLSSLEALKGKSLASNHVQAPRYLSKIVFDGKLDAEKDCKLTPTTSMLKAVRQVADGKADAALLSDDDLAWLKTSPFASQVKVTWTSAELPPMPVVAFGKNVQPKDRDAFAKMIVGMCSDAKGAQVCKDLDITKLGPADKAVWDAALKKYGETPGKGKASSGGKKRQGRAAQ